jgi:hypothetical protein
MEVKIVMTFTLIYRIFIFSVKLLICIVYSIFGTFNFSVKLLIMLQKFRKLNVFILIYIFWVKSLILLQIAFFGP